MGWRRKISLEFRAGFHALSQAGPCLLAMIGLVLFISCSGEKGKKESGKGPGAAPVLVAKAEEKTVPVEVRGIGTVEALASVSVKAQVGGVITGIHFQEGQTVAKGDLLFTLDSRSYAAAVQQAQAVLDRDTAQAELARDEARREEKLFKQSFVTEESLRQAQTAAKTLAATVRADRAALEKASLDLSYCRISAPISGKTGKFLIDPGNLVRANDSTLVVINQLHPIQVSFSVPEQEFSRINKYMAQGKLAVKAMIPGETEPALGELFFVDNAVDQSTGTILLKAAFPNQEERLWPGQYVDVALTLANLEKAVVVPSRAVQTGQQGTFVFVVKPDRTVEVRPVILGLSYGEETVVEQGLTPGLEVVTDGQLRLAPGAPVTIKSGLQDEAAGRP